ncbi:TnsA endonuclease N-terminal domain-containing protein [Heyndrickxia vini]|uniref:Heteromeric transposase endonuclease subunit TnsA n=1 Tax=Heyndrickxia vini TaxID=1476025 RepID=A0ABX7E5I8_9BACI|nr:TnsA endonuclease N-terminal domain-containing protein [Heyndrickxia vini]QQZ09607.1 heteromeric transposase endonuclease subunit TnsA [Heyndrickxia vini]
MAKRKNRWDEAKILRYIKEGRGQGELANYIPWLKIQDFPSSGNVTRLKGWKTTRQHEFLSNLERDYFFLLEWNDYVHDIREQFPLDREYTYQIASEKGIPHPVDHNTNTPIVFTTDFFITIKTNKGHKYLARTIKPSEHLENKRVIEKFEIEREYWNRKNIDWGIVTEKEIPMEISKNIQWFHKSYYIDEHESHSAKDFLKFLNSKRLHNLNVLEVCNSFDEMYHLEQGSSLLYLKHLIARKYIFIDINTKVNIRRLTTSEVILNVKGDLNFDYVSS